MPSLAQVVIAHLAGQHAIRACTTGGLEPYNPAMVIGASDARRALTNDEFEPYFQPQIELRTGHLVGFEVLARWRHPVHGIILPDAFIPLAEKDGWISDLMVQLMKRAFEAGSLFPRPLMLAINVSSVQMRDSNLPKQVRNAAEAAHFPLAMTCFEITESVLIDNFDHVRHIALELKDMGCKLALDDFGKGYSSLLHLQSLPFDELKVDRSFVGSMAEKREDRKIVAAVVGLGQSLGISTVAEGIETSEQDEMLLWLGCDVGQGWLYGKPVPADELPQSIAVPRARPVPAKDSRSVGVSQVQFDSLPARRLAQLRAVYDGAPVGLGFLDCDLRYVALNQRLAEMNGSPLSAHLGRTVKEMIPELFPQVEPFIRRALGGESISSIEIEKPAHGPNPGRTVMLSYEPARDEAGEVVGVSVSLVDVTDMKRAEQARRESEEHFRYLMNLNPQIPWVLDPHGKALDVSERWATMTGQLRGEWRGYGWLDALHPDDVQPTKDTLDISLRSGKPIDLAYRVHLSAGGWKWLHARGSARFDTNGKIQFWYGILESVEENEEPGPTE